MRVRGFILQPTYRIERGRAVVHLWGVLEGGGSFLVRDDRLVPHFYVRAADRARAREQGAGPLTATGRTDMRGRPVLCVEVATPPDTVPLRNRLVAHGVECYEADVRFATRFLIDRGIRGALEIDGEARSWKGVDRVFENPEIAPAEWAPELSALSFDIETDPRARRVLSVALAGCGVSEVLIVTPAGWRAPQGALSLATEAELLATFARRVRELDPDVLTGWNTPDFDIPVLVRRAEALGVPLELGRGRGRTRRRPARGRWAPAEISVPGRSVLDGLALLRGAFLRFDDYSLEGVAREVLGRGKLLTGRDRGREILRLFKHDRERLVAYNRLDAELVLDILGRLELVRLAVERSLLTGLPPDRVAGSIAAFDFLYLEELGRRSIVAPSVRRDGVEAEAMAGGAILEPRPGLYENVVTLDVKSLYPSLIRTFQIDPLGYVRDPSAVDAGELIVAPNGAAFRRRPSILAGILDRLFPRRDEARRRGDRVASHAIKILMNSFFGVLGTPVCRFYEPAVAGAITAFGRELLAWSRERLEEWGHRVLYGDTDSLFVDGGCGDREAARALGERLAVELTRDLAAHVEATWGVESRIEVEFERLYLKLFLHHLRGGARGASKRYAGLIEHEGKERVVFTGMEAVRRDWTELARRAQRELYGRLFAGRPLEDYLAGEVAALRAGGRDELLIYRKALRKPPEAYTATTPPHVAAARKLAGRPPRVVAYVMTVAGPEPAGERESPFDYEHYVDKQLRPVAEPILEHLGLDFARVIGDDRQIELF